MNSPLPGFLIRVITTPVGKLYKFSSRRVRSAQQNRSVMHQGLENFSPELWTGRPFNIILWDSTKMMTWLLSRRNCQWASCRDSAKFMLQDELLLILVWWIVGTGECCWCPRTPNYSTPHHTCMDLPQFSHLSPCPET